MAHEPLNLGISLASETFGQIRETSHHELYFPQICISFSEVDMETCWNVSIPGLFYCLRRLGFIIDLTKDICSYAVSRCVRVLVITMRYWSLELDYGYNHGTLESLSYENKIGIAPKLLTLWKILGFSPYLDKPSKSLHEEVSILMTIWHSQHLLW